MGRGAGYVEDPDGNLVMLTSSRNRLTRIPWDFASDD